MPILTKNLDRVYTNCTSNLNFLQTFDEKLNPWQVTIDDAKMVWR